MSPLEPASVASSPGGGGEEGRAPPPRWDAGRREERGTPKTGRRMSAPEVSTPERGGAFHEGQAPAFQRQRAGSFDDSGRGGGDGRYGEVYRHPGAEERSESGWEGGAHLPPAHNPSAPVFRASTEDWAPTDGGPSTAAGPRPPDPSLYGAGAYPGTPGEYLARRPPRPNQESGPFDGARDSTPARGRAVGDPAPPRARGRASRRPTRASRARSARTGARWGGPPWRRARRPGRGGPRWGSCPSTLGSWPSRAPCARASGRSWPRPGRGRRSTQTRPRPPATFWGATAMSYSGASRSPRRSWGARGCRPPPPGGGGSGAIFPGRAAELAAGRGAAAGGGRPEHPPAPGQA